ncbi:hypothetical protein PIECOFPK_01729 [Mycovorax composti]|jgi:hypothetical protein|uniref:Transposase n=1 Tax=Mycovorax composti TaxID=2962693 RepID=A0ABZ2EKF2_9BACT
MENLTTAYVHRAELWLFISTVVYFLMNGAQIFETLILVPKWGAAPPESLKILLDGKGTGLKPFWIIFHSFHEILFILAIIFCWRIEPVRNALLIIFALHVGLRVWTIAYFAPNIIAFQQIAENPSQMMTDIAARIARWEKLNYWRVVLYMLLSIALIPLCIKVFHLRP